MGLLKIRGRLVNAELSIKSKHPIILHNGYSAVTCQIPKCISQGY